MSTISHLDVTDLFDKECTRCHETFKLDHFNKTGYNKKTGKIYYTSNCKDCISIINRDIYFNKTKILKGHTRPRRGRKDIIDMYPGIIDKVKNILRTNPRITNAEIARQLGVCDVSVKALFTKGLIKMEVIV